MTPVTYFVVSAILTPVSLLSLMTEFRTKANTILFILAGADVILGVNLWLISWLSADQRRILPLTILAPLFFLFSALAKTRGPRFVYTYIFCLSIAVALVSVEPFVFALSHNYWIVALVQIGLLSVTLEGLSLIYRPLYREIQAKHLEDWPAYSLTPLLTLVLFFLLEEDLLDPLARLQHTELKLLLMTILLVAHVMIYLDFKKLAHLATLMDENKVLETMLDQSRLDLEEQLHKISQVRLYRHDLHHHLSVLSAAAHAQNMDEFDHYVDKLKARIDTTVITPYCAHFGINALLSVYFKKAAEAQIRLNHKILLEDALPVEVIDLAMILANGIENAINALKDLDPKDRWMTVHLQQDEIGVTLKIENPIKTEPVFQDGLPRTSLPEHGNGTRGIRMLAQHYRGFAHFSVQKGRFIVIVQLPA